MADERTEKQKVQEITDKLEEGLKELFESEKYKTYLSTMSKFYNYSFNNTLLITMQKPEVTLVAGYRNAKKQIKEANMKKVSPGDKDLITPAEAIEYYTLSWRKVSDLMNTKNNFTVKYYDERSLIIRREFEKYLVQHPELRRKVRGKYKKG